MQRKATRSQDKFDRHILSFENLIRYAVPRSAKKIYFCVAFTISSLTKATFLQQ